MVAGILGQSRVELADVAAAFGRLALVSISRTRTRGQHGSPNGHQRTGRDDFYQGDPHSLEVLPSRPKTLVLAPTGNRRRANPPICQFIETHKIAPSTGCRLAEARADLTWNGGG